MNKRDFLNITDLTRDEILHIFESARQYKEERKKDNRFVDVLKEKTVGLLFRKPSSRTRISFEVAINELGGFPVFLPAEQLQISRGEIIEDTARVFNSYLNGLVIRTFEQKEIETFAKFMDFPVINALTDEFHPCQILADFFTLWTRNKNLAEFTITYVGDANNICNTLILAADLLGTRLNVCTPPEFKTARTILAKVKNKKLVTEGTVPEEFVSASDVIYTDTWISMGQERDAGKKQEIFQRYQVNKSLLKNAKPGFLFMHCLPAHRNLEVTNEIIDGPNSIVWDQAENRLHVQKSLLDFLYTPLSVIPADSKRGTEA